MVVSELPNQFPVGGGRSAAPAVALDAAFEIRWAAWVARGRASDQRARRRFLVWAPVLAVAAVIGYAFLR